MKESPRSYQEYKNEFLRSDYDVVDRELQYLNRFTEEYPDAGPITAVFLEDTYEGKASVWVSLKKGLKEINWAHPGLTVDKYEEYYMPGANVYRIDGPKEIQKRRAILLAYKLSVPVGSINFADQKRSLHWISQGLVTLFSPGEGFPIGR
jgi:hypothetical protein